LPKKIINLIFLILIFIFVFSFLNIGNNSAYSETIYQVSVQGEIDQGMVLLVTKGIQEAEEADADRIIFSIDTFGGLVDSAIRIRDAILQTHLETIAFVPGRAWSAGALIALSAEKLVMADGSSIGAAETRPKTEKYISALRKEFQATAERRNRNSEIAAAMVDSDIAIEGIIEKNKLLSLTAGEALEYEISDLKASDFYDLKEQLNILGANFIETQLSPSERFARFVTNPAVSTVLLTIGLMAIMFEVIAPGFGVGGTVGLLSLGVFFSSFIIVGYATWGILVLFLVGLVLLFIELFIIPGFGITGFGGIIAILSSFYFLFPSPEIALSVLAVVLVLSILGTYVMIKIFGTSKIWRNISLKESQTRGTGYVSSSDKKDLIGLKGKTLTPLRPTGIARINGKRCDVVTEGDYIDKGQEIEVIEIAGSRIVVKKVEKQ